jgi:hypothetical protein
MIVEIAYFYGMARPSKIEKFTDAMRQVLDTEHSVGYAIIFTDKDLVDMANDLLDPDDRITGETFRKYKNGELSDEPRLDVFVGLYKRALSEQSANLFERLSTDVPGAWQRWAWIIERKFDDWNLRSRNVDETPAPKELVFRVSGGSGT